MFNSLDDNVLLCFNIALTAHTALYVVTNIIHRFGAHGG